MNEQEILEYIETVGQFGSVLGLDTTRELLKRLGNPQEALKIIHIAGTNGKGSTLAFISSILKQAGYKVGRFISPVIEEYREKIQINEKYISNNDLVKYMNIVKEACDSMLVDGLIHPTLFEIETALAFYYFKNKNCDVVVLETGLGGRDDATNVIVNPLASVITSISMDHMDYLGDTISEIAKIKAGIIKENSDTIIAQQDKVVEEILHATCVEKNNRVYLVQSVSEQECTYLSNKTIFSYQGRESLEIKLLGKQQVINACTAIEVAECIRNKGFQISDENIKLGLAKTKWFGRFTVIAKKPCVIIDGAHNEEAAKRLAESISYYFPKKKIIFIIGVLRDKEYENIVKQTSQLAEQIITITTPDVKRSLHAYDLAKVVREYNQNVTVADSIKEAVEMSYLMADSDSVIIAFGSFSYLGEIVRIVNEREKLFYGI